jgi:hypothetical protein
MPADITEKPVIIYTEHEVIRGTLFHARSIRLSDFMNSRLLSDSLFITMTKAQVSSRHSAEVISETDFMLLARDAIVMIYEQDIAAKPAGIPAASAIAGAFAAPVASRF